MRADLFEACAVLGVDNSKVGADEDDAVSYDELDALTAAVRAGIPVPTDATDGVLDLELVDTCCRSAGLGPRPTAKPD